MARGHVEVTFRRRRGASRAADPRARRRPRHTAGVATESSAIVVLGAGPAGAVAALGLARLGYAVAVVDAPALRPRRESFSARVVEALRTNGLEAALATLEPVGSRLVRWAGTSREIAGEAQVERGGFDAGLASDLAAHGVRVVRGEAKRVVAEGAGVRVALASGESLEAAFALEARGRAAPSGGRRERGPETTCVVQRWRGSARAARTAVISLENGWLWLADDGRGGLTTQLALDAAEAPARHELRGTLEQSLRADACAREWLHGAAPEGEAFARAATAVLSVTAGSDPAVTLRVGDAALAVDPLSGNGVFQALSTALVAPAVVNTLLRRPERAALALDFYDARARDVFRRFARITRDFYAQGAAHHGSAFWQARAAWPGAERAADVATGIALRAVVCDGWIEEREVVITPERPLGTWRIAGVELAPIVRAAACGEESAERAIAALPEAAREPVRAWLRAHRGQLGSDPNWPNHSTAPPLRSGPT